uniref:Uncharacterized protein n=1 Tax=Plectus sambesii TaxID=2011161 RepID=A0A914WT50_9BILA
MWQASKSTHSPTNRTSDAVTVCVRAAARGVRAGRIEFSVATGRGRQRAMRCDELQLTAVGRPRSAQYNDCRLTCCLATLSFIQQLLRNNRLLVCQLTANAHGL